MEQLLTLKFSEKEVNIILVALSNIAYKESASIIGSIYSQANPKQVNEGEVTVEEN